MTPISELSRQTIVNGARDRRLVRLVDGRLVRLVCWASDRRPTRARIEIRPGVQVSIKTSQVTHIDLSQPNPEKEPNNDHTRCD